MTRYVANPLYIEAHQNLGKPFPIEFAGAVKRHLPDGTLEVATRDGRAIMKYGDYLARGNDGEFFCMREGLFLSSYSPVARVVEPVAVPPEPPPAAASPAFPTTISVAVPPTDPLDAVALVGGVAAAEDSMTRNDLYGDAYSPASAREVQAALASADAAPPRVVKRNVYTVPNSNRRSA